MPTKTQPPDWQPAPRKVNPGQLMTARRANATVGCRRLDSSRARVDTGAASMSCVSRWGALLGAFHRIDETGFGDRP